MKVLWCVTGAGHLLEESVNKMRKASKEHSITVAFSKAGYEVARMYGLLAAIEGCCDELIREEDQRASCPLVGRLAKKEYSLLIVSPCTANTTAKIVLGIADSLVSNLAAQAAKSRTPTYVVPTDIKELQETTIPLLIDPEKCRNCNDCPPKETCPEKAIYRDNGVRIELLRCTACKKCIPACPFSAISFGRKVRIHIRDVDMENTRRLKEMNGLTVFENPEKIRI